MGLRIDHPAFQVAAARRMLARNGCESRVAGQVALRDADDPDTFWISPWGYFDETLPDHVVHVGMNLEVLSGDGAVSPAVGFHAEMLRDRPAACAVIHTHSAFVEVLSTTGAEVGMYSADACLFHDEQAHYFDDGVRPIVDGPRMSAALGDRSVLWLGNHGVVIVAESLALATVKAITLESSARCHAQAQLVGGKEMPTAEAVRSKRLYLENFIGAMWEANWRRLRRSDPDLFEVLDP
ncbi:MAG: class II aldolase/adducin family protein [bacterium]|nr:class II aldolase/adducin family protein [bacterium]